VSAFAFVGLIALTAALMCTPRAANALPAFSNRLGVPCKTCHEPVFPRLNRTGWEFRQLGYRTEAEMNTSIGPLASDDANKYEYGDTISVSNRDRFDDIQRQGAKAYSDFYVSGFSGYFAGAANKNFGYWAEMNFGEASTSYNSSTHEYTTSNASSVTVSPWLRYSSGKPGSFFYSRLGDISVDGFEGNNSSIYAEGPSSTLTSGVNGSSLSGRGAEFGYTHNDDALAGYLMYNNNADGGNSPIEIAQYIHFIGKNDSSVQALYANGEAPIINSSVPSDTVAYDQYDGLYLYGNWRQPVGSDFVNILAGYSNGTNHNVPGPVLATTTAGKSFNVRGYFGEVDFEHGEKFVPYIRYDDFRTGDPLVAINSQTQNENVTSETLGAAYLLEQNIRLNLDYNNSDPIAQHATVNTVRAQIWFMW
jgi:hypothetical protein